MPAITVEQALQLALLQFQSGQLAEAEATCRRILAVAPDHAAARLQLGEIRTTLAAGNRLAQDPPNASESLSEIVRLGNLLMDQGRIAEAIAAFEQGLKIDPDRPEIHYNLGNVHAKSAEWDKAAVCYHRALALRPDYQKALTNLGCIYLDQNRTEEALHQFQQNLEGPSRHYYLGVALSALGRWDDAVASYRCAIALDANYADAHWGLASTLLLLGRFKEGWCALERWNQCPARVAARSPNFASRWNGTSMAGQTLLVYEEQGYGDALHFLRYLPLVCTRSGATRVILDCPSPLRRLIVQNGGCGAEVIERQASRSPLPPCHHHTSFLDLPFALQCWEPVAISAPYLQANASLRAAWQERLGPRSRLRVGVAWAGDPKHRNDRTRSIDPGKLLPLLRVPGTEWHSLQIKPTGGQPSALLAAGLTDPTGPITDFADTAALIAELDLIISVDTAVAHLAGAMCRPVWTLLPFIPDWRWGLERQDTPWYPTMRLFRQSAPGDWDSVIRRVSGELAALVAQSTGRSPLHPPAS